MDDSLLYRWLAAERDGRESESESALFDLFCELPQASPSAGFANRVLIGAGLIPS